MKEFTHEQKVQIRSNKFNDIRARLKQNHLLNQKKNQLFEKLQKSSLQNLTLTLSQDQNQMTSSFFKSGKLSTSKKGPYQSRKSFDQKYKICEKIGQGAHGVVKKCISRKTGKQYAVKLLKMDDQQIAYLKKNFIYIESLSHPCVIKYKGMYFQQKKSLCYLIMEYFPFPNLLQVQIQSPQQLKKVTQKVIETLVFLHKNKICHRDIKPENILFDKNSGQTKIIDFGISKCIIERGCKVDMFTNTGTLYYKAPEMFLGGGYDCKIDMWALGVTLFKTIEKKTPFESTYHNETIKNILKGEVQFKDQIWQKYGFAKDLVLRLLKPAHKRLSAQQAKHHIWFDSNLTGNGQMISSMLLLDVQLMKFGSIEQFLKNKSENMKNEKNGDLKKEMKMMDWLKQDFEGVDLTDSLELC